MTNQILENNLVNFLTNNFARSPLQINCLHQSDAEIIKTCSGNLIAVTTDSIAEEIETGLYTDPYLIGWMAVTVNLSDLAAVGAEPLGILISEIIPPAFEKDKLDRMQKGISDACKNSNTFVLGGDTNSGEKFILTGTALGTFPGGKYLTRTGCRPGDLLYASGKLGKGNAYAISQFLNAGKGGIDYLPAARLNESNVIRKFAGACMDTSDGVISTLDQLMRLNGTGFELDEDWISSIDKGSLELAEKNGIPPWMLLAGQHGEFELLFTIPPEKEIDFLNKARQTGWQPVKLGKVIQDVSIKMKLYARLRTINSAAIRNISFNLKEGIQAYLRSLLKIDREMR